MVRRIRFSCFGGQSQPWRINLSVVLLLVSFSSNVSNVNSKKVDGLVDTSYANWVFLTRFCFLSNQGSLHYDIRYPVGYGTQDILLYFDTPGQWDAIYDRGKNCTEKTAVLSTNGNQIISLNTSNTQTSAYSGCKLIAHKGDTWYKCQGTRSFQSLRERWWYIALGRCGQSKDSLNGLYFEYTIHMTNGDDLLHKEFSADEFYILPVDITFLIIYIIMTTLSCACAVVLRQRHLFHSTYKLYMSSVFVWTISLILKVIAWSYYGVSGWEWSSMEVAGRVLQGLSQIVFILVLILMAKGFTITRGRLSLSCLAKIAVFISIHFVATFGLFVWERLFFDPARVLYYYESPPGYSMVALQLIGWIWFLHSAIFTLKHTDTKSLFYIPFFTFFTFWFWAGPIIVMIAMFAMAKWSREKTVNGVEQLVALLGHMLFLALTRPNMANVNFPYHVKTTQIDMVTGEEEDHRKQYLFNGNMDDYTIRGRGPNLDIFVTSKPDPDHDEIDDVSTIIDNNNSSNTDQRKPTAERERSYGPLDLKHFWFNVDSQPSMDYQTDSVNSTSATAAAQSPPEPAVKLPIPSISIHKPQPSPPPQPNNPLLPNTTEHLIQRQPDSTDTSRPSTPIEIPLSVISPSASTSTLAAFFSTSPRQPLRTQENENSLQSTLPPISKNKSAHAGLCLMSTELDPIELPSTPKHHRPIELETSNTTSKPDASDLGRIPSPKRSRSPALPAVPNLYAQSDPFHGTDSSPSTSSHDLSPNNPPQVFTNLLAPPQNRLTKSTPAPALSASHSSPNLQAFPIPFLPPSSPSPVTNKHTFSSSIALLTQTADATNIDDIIDPNSRKKRSKKKRKGKSNSDVRNSTGNQDLISRNVLAPVSAPIPRLGHGLYQFPQDLPPLPPPTPTPVSPVTLTSPSNSRQIDESVDFESSDL